MAVGRGSPANLISEITNHRVVDHLNPISVACKDHNTLLPPCSASISPLRLAAAGLPRSDEEGRERRTKPGSRPRRVKRMWSTADSVRTMLWMGEDSSRGGGGGQGEVASVGAICDDRRPEECLRALWECSALVGTLLRDTWSIGVIGPQQKGNQQWIGSAIKVGDTSQMVVFWNYVQSVTWGCCVFDTCFIDHHDHGSYRKISGGKWTQWEFSQ